MTRTAPPADADRAVDAEDYRALMRSSPGSVAVITTTDELGTPHGFTCTAWCGVSLEPPMLLFCAAKTGRTLAVLAERERFAVNVLDGGGRRAAEAFSSREAGRFAVVPWRESASTGLPLLVEDTHAVAECRVARIDSAGDHVIVLGEIIVIDAADSAEANPLLYGMRTYSTWLS